MTKILTQPFERFQERQLLLLGFSALIIASLLGYLTSTRFDGIIDVHISSSPVKLEQPFIDNLVNTAVLTLILSILARFINPKTRLIDVLNTALIARIPLYAITLFGFGGLMQETSDHMIQNITNPTEMMKLPALNLILLGFSSIYSIAALVFFGILLYRGFKTATNLKKGLHKFLILVAVIAAEFISKLLVYLP